MAGVGGHGTAHRQRNAHHVRTAQSFGAFDGVARIGGGRGVIAAQDAEHDGVQRHPEHLGVGAPVEQAVPNGLQLHRRGVDVTGPHQQDGVDGAGTQRDRRIEFHRLQLQRPLHGRPVIVSAAQTVDPRVDGQRRADELIDPEPLGLGQRFPRVRCRLVVQIRAYLRKRQHRPDERRQHRITGSIGQRALQVLDPSEIALGVDVHGRAQQERDRSGDAGRRPLDGRSEDRGRGPGVSGTNVIVGSLDSALGRVGAEPDGQLEQLGGLSGSSAVPRHGGGLVQRGQGDRVGGRGGQGEVTCPQLGFGDQVGQTPVYLPPLLRLGIGVDALGEQRVVEPHPVPDHGDHPCPLAALQQLDGALNTRPHGRGDRLYGRVRRAGGDQQDGADLVAQRADPQSHQLGQRRGEFGVAA